MSEWRWAYCSRTAFSAAAGNFFRPPKASGSSSGPNSRPTGAREALRVSPTLATSPSGGGTSRCVHMASGKKRVVGPPPFAAFCASSRKSPTEEPSKAAGSNSPLCLLRRSRPPEGATQKMCPPSLNRRCISVTVSRFRADLTSFSSVGKLSRYFFEKMVSKFRPMLKGTASGSVVTLCPATKTQFSASSSSPSMPSKIESTWGSASVWWFASNITLSPSARRFLISATWFMPSTRELRYFTMERKKSLPQV
mmetsp:Transcript_80546/g.222819  ORF Transcript_80546/g.222819 Transcript_80546/m.222819 type:complete len:252 (+) Transcript_80546:129-884(+)